MALQIRKPVTHMDETLIEGGRGAEKPWFLMAVATVVASPWVGQGIVKDLCPEILSLAPPLGDVLMSRVLEACGAETYGKSAVVGLNGETEHGSGFHPHPVLRQQVPRGRGRHVLSFVHQHAVAVRTVDPDSDDAQERSRLPVPLHHARILHPRRARPRRDRRRLPPRPPARTTISATAIQTWMRWASSRRTAEYAGVLGMKQREVTCACGAFKALCRGESVKISLCHCLDCQKRTGSALGIAAFFERPAVAASAFADPALSRPDPVGLLGAPPRLGGRDPNDTVRAGQP